jgi:hypothetical protein
MQRLLALRLVLVLARGYSCSWVAVSHCHTFVVYDSFHPATCHPEASHAKLPYTSIAFPRSRRISSAASQGLERTGLNMGGPSEQRGPILRLAPGHGKGMKRGMLSSGWFSQGMDLDERIHYLENRLRPEASRSALIRVIRGKIFAFGVGFDLADC